MYKIIIEKQVKRRLDRLDDKTTKRISKAILDIATFPQKGDFKKLSGKYKGLFRLRVGGLRILFQVAEETKEIRVFKIDTRGDIY